MINQIVQGKEKNKGNEEKQKTVHKRKKLLANHWFCKEQDLTTHSNVNTVFFCIFRMNSWKIGLQFGLQNIKQSCQQFQSLDDKTVKGKSWKGDFKTTKSISYIPQK